MARDRFSIFIFAFLFLLSGNLCSAMPTDAFELSLEQLMEVEVVSATKKPQSLTEIPAAVYVIEKEDIRRSGAANIPEILRMAPGLQVLYLSNNRWAISIRGAMREYSNKLLVMVDGRSVYSPTFSGVFWEALDLPIETIERIEVIRGPGSSIWGANAVNGVINIITSPARSMQGTSHSIYAGDVLSTVINYGWQPEPDRFMRVYAKGLNTPQSHQPGPARGEDALKNFSAGFRMDQTRKNQDFSLSGNIFSSSADDRITLFAAPPSANTRLFTQRMNGVSLNAHWNRKHSDGSISNFHSCFEHTSLDHIFIDEKRATLDLEYNRRLRPDSRHDLVLGIASRLSQDFIDNSKFMWVDETSRLTDQFRLFFTDEITLSENRLWLTISSMLEHNEYTGFCLQPSLRLLFRADNRTSCWLSFSQACRTPSRLERGTGYFDQAAPSDVPPTVVKVYLDNFSDEKVKSFEIGWKKEFNESFNIEFTGFYNQFRDLASSNIVGINVIPPGYVLIDASLGNEVAAEIRGMEMTLAWQTSKNLKLLGNYSYLNIDTSAPIGIILADVDQNFPQHAASLRTMFNPTNHLQWDNWLIYRSDIELGNFAGFYSLDSRLAWRIKPGLSLAFVCQNVFDADHRDFAPEVLQSQIRETGRRMHLKLEWNY
ncbi:MAG: TonB-dependent receptor [Candidatus Riflebacteria bacterium]